MNKQRIFISSVQSEFAKERRLLYHYISTDALLGRFFEPFIFEELPAVGVKPDTAYLKQVHQCDIYLGIFGKRYGYEDKNGTSPTEHEYNLALKENKTRFIFISTHTSEQRESKELSFIRKVEKEVVRKKFSSPSELKTAVYASLVNYLEEKEFIRTGPFDAVICKGAAIADIDTEKIKWFVETARAKRNFPFSPLAKPEAILTHLNLLKENKLTNAALLLFGKNPQRYFITAEIRCVLFHGNEIRKPIPAYQVYKGDVFEQVNQAVDFVLSRINLSVGDRSKSVEAPIEYEIPRSAVAEAIVNAVAHRDYSSTGSVQVMLFRNRLEVWNPGHLPSFLSIPKLKKAHGSFPPNPLLAEPLYLAGFIERLGTGIPDMVKACLSAGLKEPELVQEEEFKTILWRKEHVTDQVPTKYRPSTDQVRRLILVMEKENTRQELMDILELRHNQTFRENYLHPALDGQWVEMTIPDKPNDPKQKYYLTKKGKTLQQQLKKKKQ